MCNVPVIRGGRRLTALAMLLVCGSAASAGSRAWDGGLLGAYENAANWTGDTLPELNDTIVFNQSPSMTVTFAADAVVARLLHNGGDLNLELNGNTLDLRSPSNTSTSWTSSVVASPEGDVEIIGGTVLCTWANIGDGLTDSSRVNLRDPAARFESRESIRVGAFGQGLLNLENGADCISGEDLIVGQSQVGTGTFIADGPGSVVTVADQIQVAALGNGAFQLRNGAVATCESFFVAAFDVSNGQALITGPGSSLAVNNTIGVGFEGTGSVIVASGGRLEGLQMRVGFLTGSVGTVTVQGADATLETTAGVTVGGSGAGEILVRNGGSATFGELALNSGPGVASLILEDPESSLVVTGNTSLGVVGNGVIELRPGVLADMRGVNIGPTGLLVVDQATLVTETLSIESPAASRDAARGLLVETGLFGLGTISGAVESDGRIAPDPFESAIAITGDLTLTERSILELDVNLPSVVAPRFDRLTVGGNVSLGGILRLVEVASFSPPLGTRLPIIQGPLSVTGDFEQFDSPALPEGRRWIAVATSGDVEIVVTVPGDLTGDLTVDAADLAALLARWGQPSASADFNGDGTVGAEDLAALIANWG